MITAVIRSAIGQIIIMIIPPIKTYSPQSCNSSLLVAYDERKCHPIQQEKNSERANKLPRDLNRWFKDHRRLAPLSRLLMVGRGLREDGVFDMKAEAKQADPPR